MFTKINDHKYLCQARKKSCSTEICMVLGPRKERNNTTFLTVYAPIQCVAGTGQFRADTVRGRHRVVSRRYSAWQAPGSFVPIQCVAGTGQFRADTVRGRHRVVSRRYSAWQAPGSFLVRFYSACYFKGKNYLLSVKQIKGKCSTDKITHLNLNLKTRQLARRFPTGQWQLLKTK